MRLVIADSFTRSLEKLDPQSQNLVKQAAFDLQVNPVCITWKFTNDYL